jgi:hypothetical protein
MDVPTMRAAVVHDLHLDTGFHLQTRWFWFGLHVAFWECFSNCRRVLLVAGSC